MGLFDINNAFTIIFGYPLSYAEFIATIFGLFSIWLATKQNIWTWITGLINIVFSFVIFYQVRLYADMFLQIYFFITNIFGWWVWKNQFRENRPVTSLSGKARIILFILILVCTIAFGIVVKNIHVFFPRVFSHPASFPFTDTFVAVASMAGAILLAKRIIDNWTILLIVDIVCVFLFAIKGIKLISFEYAIFCLLACLGMFSWRKSIENLTA